MRVFGAHAVTCGLLLGTADMSRRSWSAFGLAVASFMGFNVWMGIGPGKGMFTKWLWMDFVGNAAFALGSAWCVKLLGEQEEEEREKKEKLT